jgi:hypothetical protein
MLPTAMAHVSFTSSRAFGIFLSLESTLPWDEVRHEERSAHCGCYATLQRRRQEYGNNRHPRPAFTNCGKPKQSDETILSESLAAECGKARRAKSGLLISSLASIVLELSGGESVESCSWTPPLYRLTVTEGLESAMLDSAQRLAAVGCIHLSTVNGPTLRHLAMGLDVSTRSSAPHRDGVRASRAFRDGQWICQS